MDTESVTAVARTRPAQLTGQLTRVVDRFFPCLPPTNRNRSEQCLGVAPFLRILGLFTGFGPHPMCWRFLELQSKAVASLSISH